jgi:RHS repeat-associated protein
MNNSRSTMYYGGLQADKLARPFRKHYSTDGSMEIKQIGAVDTEFITYIGGDAYSAPVVLKSDGTTQNYLYLHRDYQGSIVAISNQSGVVVEKRLFDAWGELLRVQDQQGDILAGLTVLDRGYTGHEHLQSVGLIHMNGRLYDAKLHRFLQPDNYIQDPYNTQNYNRYGYVLNNPLKYTDPSGEIITIGTAILIGAIIGGTTYTLTALLTPAPFSVGGFLKASFFGGLSGAVTFGIGTAVQSLPIAEKIVAGAFMHGTSQGIMTGIQGGDPLSAFVSGAVSSIAAGLWSTGGAEGKWQGVGGAWAKSDFGTLAFGTFAGGAGAQLSGGNFWQGAVTGLVVSGLNHVAHKMGQRRSLLSRFKNKALAFQKADVSEAGIANLHQNVDGLSLAYKDGGSPAHAFDADGYGEYATTTETTVHLNKSLLSTKNNLFFAGVLFHEYRHSFQYYVPYTVGGKNFKSRVDAYLSIYGKGSYIPALGETYGGYLAAMEYDAYAFQYRMGDNATYVVKNMNYFAGQINPYK